MHWKKAKISLDDIEKTACDGKHILGINGLQFLNKKYAAGYAIMPADIALSEAAEAIKAAEKRVIYAYNIELFLRPCPTELCYCFEAQYEEAARLIIRDINRDFGLSGFEAKESESRLIFSFDLLVPSSTKKKNAELLNELKSQFKKLSNSIVLSVTIIRI